MSRIERLPSVRRALLAWHDAHALSAPWRESGDPYACLVAATMAQQTQMSRVLPLFDRFMASFPTVETLAAAPAGDVIRAWAGMGYNARAVRLHRAAKQIAAVGWPRDARALAEIEGIGPFTAAIVASFAFGEDAACVDTNVRRVLGRLAGAPEIDGRALQRLADSALPTGHAARWNQALMDYGATVCRARPRCDECVVARSCAWRAAGAEQARVAEARAPYVVGRALRTEPRFETTSRYIRGRIVEALRELAPGESLRIDRLRDAVPAAGTLGANDLRAMLQALERDGLASISGEAVSLPL